MALVELKTDLKSLKNSTFGAKALLVGKDINDPPKSKGLMMQVTRRADDLVRHTKLLGRREGLKFIGNQALLAQTNLKQKIKQGKKDNNLKEVMKNQLIQTGINTVAGTASILAQIPVNGTGTHLIRGFGGISYLTPSAEPSNINGFIARISKNLAGGTGNTVNAAVNSLNGELTILDTPATSQHKETEGTEKSKFINDKGEISRATPYGAEDTTENNYINSHVKYKNGGASVDLGSLPSALPAEEERVNSQDADQGGGAKKIPLRKRIDSTDGQSMFGETVSTSNRVVRTSSIRNENYETYKITGSQEINSVSSSISDKQEDSKRQERTSIISSQESLEKAQNYDLYKTTGSQEINSVSSSISEKLENSERQERTSIISSQEKLENAQNYDVYKVDGEALGTMQNPIILHNPGKTRLGADGTVTDEADRPDAIQNLGIETSALGAAQEDLIPIIKKHAPDWRRVLNETQRRSIGGILSGNSVDNSSVDSASVILKHLKEKNFKEMRKWVTNNIDTDTSAIFRSIYDNMQDHIKPHCIPQVVLTLADYQYKSAFVADIEINTVACLTEIMSQVEFK